MCLTLSMESTVLFFMCLMHDASLYFSDSPVCGQGRCVFSVDFRFPSSILTHCFATGRRSTCFINYFQSFFVRSWQLSQLAKFQLWKSFYFVRLVILTGVVIFFSQLFKSELVNDRPITSFTTPLTVGLIFVAVCSFTVSLTCIKRSHAGTKMLLINTHKVNVVSIYWTFS